MQRAWRRRPEVVEAVGQGEGLRIGQALAHLLDAAVYVATVHVELADDLALERDAEAQHAVRSRVLGADVDDVLVLLEDRLAVADETSVVGEFEALGRLLGHLVAHAQGIQRRIVVLAQGISHPVVAQEEPAHVGVVQETDAEIVVCLAFVELGGTPQVADRIQHGVLPVRGQRPQHKVFSRAGGFEVVNHAEPLFAPVHARKAAQEVEPLLLEPGGHRMQPVGRQGHHAVARLSPLGRGFPARNLLFPGRIHRLSSLSTFNSFFSAVRSRLSSSSYSFSPIWRFTPPKKRCRRTLRWSCISP